MKKTSINILIAAMLLSNCAHGVHKGIEGWDKKASPKTKELATQHIAKTIKDLTSIINAKGNNSLDNATLERLMNIMLQTPLALISKIHGNYAENIYNTYKKLVSIAMTSDKKKEIKELMTNTEKGKSFSYLMASYNTAKGFNPVKAEEVAGIINPKKK